MNLVDMLSHYLGICLHDQPDSYHSEPLNIAIHFLNWTRKVNKKYKNEWF